MKNLEHHFMLACGLVLLSALSAGSAVTQTIAYDGFEYPVGTTASNDPNGGSPGTGWSADWVRQDGVGFETVSGSLSYPAGTSSNTPAGNSAATRFNALAHRFVNHTFSNNSTIYTSFLFQQTNVTNFITNNLNGVVFFLELKLGFGVVEKDVGGGFPNDEYGLVLSGVKNRSGVPATLNRTIFVVIRFDRDGSGNITANLFIDPPGGAPSRPLL